MSLGFPSSQSFGNLRQDPFPPPAARPAAEPPLRLRIEAIEIALGRLSQTVQDLAADVEVSLDDGEGEEGESRASSMAKRLTDLEAELEGLRGVTEQLNEVEAASGLAAMHVRARVSRNTKMYPNKTGDFKKDVKASNTPTVLPPDTQLRLVFPQEKLSDGRLCMGGVCVDAESMALTTGWVIVADTKKKLHFVDSFAV